MTSESEEKFSEFDSDLYTTTDVEVGDTKTTPQPIKKKTQTTLPPPNNPENAFPLSESNSDSDTEIKKCSSANYQIDDAIQKREIQDIKVSS